MKILFLLPTGVIEWPVPPDINPPFHFGSVATRVRMDGYFLADNLYLRHDTILGMSLAADDAPPPIVRQGTLQ